MEFLVEFDVDVPAATPESEVTLRYEQESVAAGRLATDGHLIRLWRPLSKAGGPNALGLYRAGDRAELDKLVEALPLYDWMHVTVTPLASHPNDPAAVAALR
jgi:muconolactone D-isomerase